MEWKEKDGRIFLTVVGTDKLATERAVLRLLDILDRKHPFYGVVGGPMFTKAGVDGKPLLH